MIDTKHFARKLRAEMTDAERFLWQHIRKRQLNHKFRRQQSIGAFIVDFICFEKKLILELDGGQHDVQLDADQTRTKWLEQQGYKVLRFWNNDVLTNIEGVIDSILQALR